MKTRSAFVTGTATGIGKGLVEKLDRWASKTAQERLFEKMFRIP
jgi:NAD(P)-dependent dehydrogenase (short-subunit alcohol dehydrogenase family)